MADSPYRSSPRTPGEATFEAVGNESINEPPSGYYVRARYADHHTAGYVWHRDDREGHPPWKDGLLPQVWWSHNYNKWMSWTEIRAFVDAQPQPLVLEPLFPPPPLPGCAPDGTHSSCADPLDR
jgi:hypothetical protein